MLEPRPPGADRRGTPLALARSLQEAAAAALAAQEQLSRSNSTAAAALWMAELAAQAPFDAALPQLGGTAALLGGLPMEHALLVSDPRNCQCVSLLPLPPSL